MNDKIQHFIVGFALSLLGFVYFPLIILGFAFGVGKEIFDMFSKNHTADWYDLWATALGAALATTLIIAHINYLYR